MMAFAATGWQEEDGTWRYYDKNGDEVTSSWKKSGNDWFWLDEDGRRWPPASWWRTTTIIIT